MILVGVVPADPAAVARVRALLGSASHIAVAAMPPEALAAAGPAVSVLVLVDEVTAADRAAVLAAYAGRLRPPGLLLVRPPTAPQDDLPTLLRLAGVGLVEEDAPGPEAVAAVEALARGGFYLSALYQFRWKECFLSAVTARVQPPPSPLTAREQEVLAELAEGKSNAEIARALFIGLNTVDTHLMSIFRKLGVHNRTEAVAMTLRGGAVLRTADPARRHPVPRPATLPAPRRPRALPTPGRPHPAGALDPAGGLDRAAGLERAAGGLDPAAGLNPAGALDPAAGGLERAAGLDRGGRGPDRGAGGMPGRAERLAGLEPEREAR